MQASSKKLLIALGQVIYKHRCNTGKSVYKISAESCIAKSTWLRIEKGIHSNIDLTTLWKIAEGLEISLEYLINDVKNELGEKFSLIDE